MPGTPERTTTVKEWLTSLIGGAPFGILAFDLQGVCTLANVAAGDAFDTAPDRLVDRLSIEIIAEWPELESAMLNSVLPAAEEGGRFDYDCERVVRGERSYNVRGRTIVDGMLMTIDDITAEVRMRREQDLLVEHLEATNRELAEFAYICAHDMKSPVDSLVGLVDDMASFDNMPPEISPAFAIVQRSVKALDKNVRSVNKILEVKKTIGAGSGAGDLRSAIDDVLTVLQPCLAEVEAAVSVDVVGDTSVCLSTPHLRTVVQNLVENAIKYRAPDRPLRVTIRSIDEGGGLLLEVSDNGRGFDSERFQSKVFGLFNRLHQDVEGSGIGLYLVSSIVRSIGGTVSARSYENVGSTFTVRAPHAR